MKPSPHAPGLFDAFTGPVKPPSSPGLDPFLGSKVSRAMWRACMMDPNWNERGGGKSKRGADKHYKTADVRKIRQCILGSGLWMPYPDAHLFMWYTDNFLLDALWLTNELGFTYKRTFQWGKIRGLPMALDFDTGLACVPHDGELETRDGIGQYARGAHEGMIFATRGRGMSPSVYRERKDIPSLVLAPHVMRGGKRVHSAKPDAFYELVEARSHGPYLEMFARRGRPGWQSWGDEAPEEAEDAATTHP